MTTPIQLYNYRAKGGALCPQLFLRILFNAPKWYVWWYRLLGGWLSKPTVSSPTQSPCSFFRRNIMAETNNSISNNVTLRILQANQQSIRNKFFEIDPVSEGHKLDIICVFLSIGLQNKRLICMYQGANYRQGLTVGEIINWGGGGAFLYVKWILNS